MAPADKSRKRSVLLPAAAGAVLLPLLIAVWWPRGNAETAGDAGSRKAVEQKTWWPAPPVAAGPWPESKNNPAYGAEVHRRLLPWLNARGRDAPGLIAVWELTGDQKLLEEAAEKYPDNARVCLAMIASFHKGLRADALPWIERFIAAEPQNPEGYFLKASALLYPRGQGLLRFAKKPDTWAPAIAEAVAAPAARNDYKRERFRLRREAALAGGAGPAEAVHLAISMRAGLTGWWSELIMELDEVPGPQPPVEDTAAFAAWKARAGMALAAVEKLEEGNAARAGVFSEGTVRSIIGRLPREMVITPAGRTVGQLRDAQNQWRAEQRQYMRAGEFYPQHESDDIVTGYGDHYAMGGELAAIRYLHATRTETGEK